MNKKNLVLGIASLVLVSSSWASTTAFTNRYDLPSNELVTLKGNLFTTKKVVCEVRSESEKENILTFVSLHNTNIINGFILPEGETTSFATRIGNHLHLEMEQNSEIGITNTGDALVNLECK